MRVALITGGTRGIGLSIINLLALDEKIKVITCGTKPSPETEFPEGVEYIQCDISNSSNVTTMIKLIIEKHHRIDILINNAGISHVKSDGRILIEDVENVTWHKVINTNLSGAFYTCKQVIPFMKKNQYGRIINISSASARSGGILASVDYISSKAGLIGLTKGLAYELKDGYITVNAIAPGRIATDMISDINLSIDWIKNHIPLGRLGRGEDIAGVVLFLISKHANYMHGATIDCNGGWVIT